MRNCDWLPARLFVTQLEGDHVGIQLQLTHVKIL